MKILKEPTDDESDQVFNEMTSNEALFWSIKGRLLEYIKRAIERGANVNSYDDNGITPLMVASEIGQIDIVKFLIEHGADVNSYDEDGYTAIMKASDFNSFDKAPRGSQLKIIKFLIEHGADVNMTNNHGYTALDLVIDVYNEIDELLTDENPYKSEINMDKFKIFKEYILELINYLKEIGTKHKQKIIIQIL